MAAGDAVNQDSAAAEALFFEGNRLMAAGDASAAEACFREAIALVPDFAEAHANLGLLLDQAGRLDEAEAAYQRAIDLMPALPATWSNLGVLQACRKQEAAAEMSYRTAMALDPDYRLACFNLAYLLLRQGRYEEGWACFEKRDWYAQLETLLPCPRWQGEPLAGRSLLIGFEAGHGDMIQFCRYAAVLKGQGAAHITVICHPALKTLFTTLSGVDAVYAFDETFPPSTWDFWTPPLSIPFHCRTRLDSIPEELPYLHAEPERARRWSATLSAQCAPDDLRVGLVWKGNPRFENDADRSLPGLTMLEPLGAVAGVRFFSLQKGVGEDEAANPPPGLPVANLGPQLADFADTAAVVANLDLVICVDTAVAHLAGALGKHCWVLLPDYKTDWRWLSGRTDSPWYPGVMRLFRQSRMGDWGSVVGEVAAALRLHVLSARTGPANRE